MNSRFASALIEARSKADMTQEQVAEAMGTTQAVDYLGHRDPKHTVHYTRVAGSRFEGLWQ